MIPSPAPSSVNDPFTPTSQNSRERSVLSQKPEWIRSRLAQHGIVKTSREILRTKYPDFEASIQEILRKDRHSAMKPSSVRKFSERHEIFEGANEATVLSNLIPLLIKESHILKLSPESVEYKTLRDEKELSKCNSEDDEDILVPRDWFDEGVIFAVNQEFRASLLPNVYDNDNMEVPLRKALSKSDGMSNPKPDYCWGFRLDLLDRGKPTDVQFIPEIASLMQPAPPLEGVFFLIEGKSNQGNALQAKIQAQRGGAALVNAARKLSMYTTPADNANEKGADTQSFVFSATLTIQCMNIYLHWAEDLHPTVKDTGELQSHQQVLRQELPRLRGDASTHTQNTYELRTLFHMTLLRSYALLNLDLLPELRHVLHNILQWGATDRLEQVKSQRLRLYKYHQEHQKAAINVGIGLPRPKRQRTDEGEMENLDGA